MFICSNCDHEYKSKGGLTRHINSKKCNIKSKLEKPIEKSIEKPIEKPMEKSIEQPNKDQLDLTVYSNISNKDALKYKIHEIHNFMRNSGAGYGMNALKTFNLIYGLKKLEENNLIKKTDLKCPECEYSYLLALANDPTKHTMLTELIFTTVLDSISQSSIRDLLFYEIPKNINNYMLAYLIKQINEITNIEKSCNVLLSGKIYEYFIGRDESAISELGAYFTDRHIVDFIYNKINIEINKDGSINTMLDMFGGSGGFTTGYINYLNNKYPKLIDWETEINKIYHFDLNDDVLKSAGLEFFCLTGALPNMRKNINAQNAFTTTFESKYKYIITNPPYGGDKTKTTDQSIKRSKIISYLKKQLYIETDIEIKKHKNNQLQELIYEDKLEKIEFDKLKVNLDNCSRQLREYGKLNGLKCEDKEACALLLMTELLDEDGTCVGVLKEGLMFNSIYKDLRKHLLLNFNIEEIISVPNDQFENTTTKTSIIIFNNKKEKLEKIIFSELIVEKYTEDKFIDYNNIVYLVENKDDIKNIINKDLLTVNISEILKNVNYSLNYKDYEMETLQINKDYKLVKIGELCEFGPKSKRNASFGNQEGDYNFYSSCEKILKCNIADYKDECILIGDGGNSCIHYIDNIEFSYSNHMFVLKSKIKEINTRYIYYTLLSLWDNIINKMNGSVIKNLSKEKLFNCAIYIPNDISKIPLITDSISEEYDKIEELKRLIFELENQIKDLIINYEGETKEYKLSELCIFLNKSKRLAGFGKKVGEYNFYTSSNNIKKCSIADYNTEAILIGTGGNSCCHYINGLFSCSGDIILLKSINNDIDTVLCYNTIKINFNNLCNKMYGSTIKHLNKEILLNFSINIPIEIEKYSYNIKEFFNKKLELENELIQRQKKFEIKIEDLKQTAINN